MQRTLFLASALFLGAAWIASHAFHQAGALVPAPEAPEGIVAAAEDFLAALDPEKAEKARFEFKDDERFQWHFVPRPREGIPLKELDGEQKEKARSLLEASVSRVGYRRAEQVRWLEGVLAEIEGEGSRFRRDPELYYVSIFGTPSSSEKWGWRLEGHHLSLNFTLQGEKLVGATPMFYGANPALVPLGPKKGLRVLGEIEDTARNLVQTLDDRQRKAAVGKEPQEVQGVESARYNTALPEGLAASEMREEQRLLLRSIVLEYTRNLGEGRRQALEKAIEEDFGKIQFAWRGGTKPFEPHSYLIHGPAFIVSYVNEQNGARHIHSALRDLTSDFGLDGKE